jgi:hypothetical protein
MRLHPAAANRRLRATLAKGLNDGKARKSAGHFSKTHLGATP